MPELITSVRSRKMEPGAVLQVARRMQDKKTQRTYYWRFFFVVTEHRRGSVHGLIAGAENPNFKDKEIFLSISDERNTVHYLAESEWPDGVIAFRMSMILKGLIEDI